MADLGTPRRRDVHQATPLVKVPSSIIIAPIQLNYSHIQALSFMEMHELLLDNIALAGTGFILPILWGGGPYTAGGNQLQLPWTFRGGHFGGHH